MCSFSFSSRFPLHIEFRGHELIELVARRPDSVCGGIIHLIPYVEPVEGNKD